MSLVALGVPRLNLRVAPPYFPAFWYARACHACFEIAAQRRRLHESPRPQLIERIFPRTQNAPQDGVYVIPAPARVTSFSTGGYVARPRFKFVPACAL
jgi:hypothetical protein